MAHLSLENWVAGLEFNPSGETVATIDCYGNCLISDLNTDSYIYHLSMGKGESGIREFHDIFLSSNDDCCPALAFAFTHNDIFHFRWLRSLQMEP